jgi:TatD family-associated radical SAM protein
LRHNKDHVFESDSLWLDREPSVKEVCESIDAWDLTRYNEIVFCGYGEPTERLYDLLEVAKYIKAKINIKTRINTNGLADLIWNEATASKLEGLIDTVSISLNATNKEDYYKVVRPKFGIGSYDAMLKFAKDCTKYVPSVVMTVVDVVTSNEDQELCRRICESVGATLRVRPYVAD